MFTDRYFTGSSNPKLLGREHLSLLGRNLGHLPYSKRVRKERGAPMRQLVKPKCARAGQSWKRRTL